MLQSVANVGSRLSVLAALALCLSFSGTAMAQVEPDATGDVWAPNTAVPPKIGAWELYITGDGELDFVIHWWNVGIGRGNCSICRPFGFTDDGSRIMFKYEEYQVHQDASLTFISAGQINLDVASGDMATGRPEMPTRSVQFGDWTQTEDINHTILRDQPTHPFAFSESE